VFKYVFLFCLFIFPAVAQQDDVRTQQELSCLSRAIYWEARGENERGMRAVAHVVMNRVEDGRWGNSVCSVVHYRRGGRCQFSWACTRLKHAQPSTNPQWTLAQRMARSVYFEQPDITNGALYFHARYVRPSWRSEMVEVAEDFGQHRFYRER
jgi:N-acetylmuramoyl-L-alanine amidase